MARGAKPQSIINPLVDTDLFYSMEPAPRWLDDIVTGSVRALGCDMNSVNPHPVVVGGCIKALTQLEVIDVRTLQRVLNRPSRSCSVGQARKYYRAIHAAIPHIIRHMNKG